ncbi:LysR family transcriptional regulator [Alphaproteobacteria bacterium GH1-50]|uniref:LysR family transcriptional regulator n=1 Tax=Kangsaoukella pontilimi TaxID=2691042 RepID=A0A7C9NDR1_9RHOB|nr:LysR family transcriptional regulator [Kangsaoukella pontilimi]MXQ07679.1 LysR family transcriptional regulator [Kangsaoukella pontilimi]
MKDWDDMRIFLSVARAESLSGAAKVLRVDPATVSRRIARLEAEADAVLFVKSPQGYVPTEAGARLIAHAEAAERAMEAAREDLQGRAEGLTGTIRLGAPDGCATYLLPVVTARIVRANPGLDIQVVALPRVFNLSRREADMAIGVSRPTAGRLRIQKIADYTLSLAASHDYLRDCPPIRTRADLREHPIVGYIPDMIFDSELDYLAEAGLSHVDFASNSVPVQIAWLRAGAGVGVIHDFALPDAPGLDRVLPEDFRLTRAFWLIRHADDARVARLNRFAEALTEEMRAEIAERARA